jgi:molybdopterin-guanine dinucleotide biosynthesis protein A
MSARRSPGWSPACAQPPTTSAWCCRTPAVLLDLASAGADVATPQTGPLPGAYRRTALPALEAALADGRLSLRDSVAGLDRLVIEIDPDLLVNVNTADELDRI